MEFWVNCEKAWVTIAQIRYEIPEDKEVHIVVRDNKVYIDGKEQNGVQL